MPSPPREERTGARLPGCAAEHLSPRGRKELAVAVLRVLFTLSRAQEEMQASTAASAAASSLRAGGDAHLLPAHDRISHTRPRAGGDVNRQLPSQRFYRPPSPRAGGNADILKDVRNDARRLPRAREEIRAARSVEIFLNDAPFPRAGGDASSLPFYKNPSSAFPVCRRTHGKPLQFVTH